MIICGANGSGKSTLLWALKQRVGLVLDPADTQVLYQSPHRAIRKQTVQRRWVGGAPTSYADSLSLDNVAAPEGIQIPYPSRSPDNVDESGSTIKHTLARLENRRQSYIALKHDEAVRGGATSLDLTQVKTSSPHWPKLLPGYYPTLHLPESTLSRKTTSKSYSRGRQMEILQLLWILMI